MIAWEVCLLPGSTRLVPAVLVAIGTAMVAPSIVSAQAPPPPSPRPDASRSAGGVRAEDPAAAVVRLRAMAARFAPVPLTADASALPSGERQALAKLVQAARIVDTLFLRQAWAGNETLLLSLIADDTPLGRARLHYFLINKGPWSRLDQDAPFIPGVG